MSVKQKLTLIIAGIIFVLLAAHLVHLRMTSSYNLKEEASHYLRDVSARLANDEAMHNYIDSVGTPHSLVVNEVVEMSAFRIIDSQPVLVDGAYRLYRGSGELDIIRNMVDNKEKIKDVRLNDGTHAMVFYKLLDRDEPVVVRTVMSLKNADILMRKQMTEQIMLSAILLVVMTLIAYLLLGRIFRPLDTIVWKIGKLSNAQFDDMIPVKGHDEFGQLSLQMNNMSKNISVYMNKLRLAFEENRAMKDHLESFINHTTDAIHVVDLNGRILSVNHAFTQMFGYKESEAVGFNLPLVPSQWQQEEQKAMEAVKAGKVLPPMESTRVTKSGEWLAVSVTTSPIRDAAGTVRAIASITRDMTGRNKMEDLLRQSEKLTTVGQLAAGVAHEIRNPLTTLKGFLQLQRQTNKLNINHVEMMMAELDRINLIVGEFLILAKPQATKFEVKDIRYIMGDVLSLLDSEAHLHGIVFKYECPDTPCYILCEENQLKQVFINLLKNAMESMPRGGTISIIGGRGENGEATITITDEGCGISEDMIRKLGDPFVTGKESGTGLGIMVSQRIIQSHRGTLEFKSQIDVGTTAAITLPCGDSVSELQQEHGMMETMKHIS
ncbi:PAS domain S-box-containing protein [Paenibacillus cellulosilyticus]|uniref:histidine kinase n=1 Tax=Paenibacillus cellulosilyticus TaxID=375489 RepID=A0A2V2YNJ6_9BACL|nr:PAS domain S-box protein [Paenibacillus cellulosilyticus]PWV97390.1 PAS domain S-box-containing protein [Paenibacillus cellulosilyticus]QKS48568.1 PAS domain S-box protein [Paenibacillus cellulosilyticus]